VIAAVKAVGTGQRQGRPQRHPLRLRDDRANLLTVLPAEIEAP
jgi:hypothetical protein